VVFHFIGVGLCKIKALSCAFYKNENSKTDLTLALNSGKMKAQVCKEGWHS